MQQHDVSGLRIRDELCVLDDQGSEGVGLLALRDVQGVVGDLYPSVVQDLSDQLEAAERLAILPPDPLPPRVNSGHCPA